ALPQLRAAVPRWVPAWYASLDTARDLGAALRAGTGAAWYAGLGAAGDTRAETARTNLMNVVSQFVPMPRGPTGIVTGTGAGAQYGLQELIDLLVRLGQSWENLRQGDTTAGRTVR